MDEIDIESLMDMVSKNIHKVDLKNVINTYLKIYNWVQNRDASHDYIEEFLMYVKADLDACKTLYASKNYSQSVYHLQQATEKLTKAYALFFGIIKRKDVKRGIGHITPKIFLQLIQKKSLQQFIDEINKTLEKPIPTDASGLKKLIQRKNIETARFSKKEILQMLGLIHKIREICLPQATLMEVVQHVKKSIDIEELADRYKDDEQFDKSIREFKSIASKIVKTKIETLYEASSNFIMLFLLSAVTFRHMQFVRYPHEEKSDLVNPIKLEEYRQGFGIVDTTSDILKRLWDNYNYLMGLLNYEKLR